jgi:hypothetical protein
VRVSPDLKTIADIRMAFALADGVPFVYDVAAVVGDDDAQWTVAVEGLAAVANYQKGMF